MPFQTSAAIPVLTKALNVALIFLTLNASAQTNAYKFIEPNISFAYDSTQVKIGSVYSNSAYNTEAVDFLFHKDKSANIHVTANHPAPDAPTPDARFIDSVMLSGMNGFRNEVGKEIEIVKYDTVIHHINTFSCAGFIVHDATRKKYATSIICNHVSANDATEVHYTSTADTSLETGYKRLETFLAGFKSYSAEVIQKEEEEIQKTYKAVIKKTNKVLPGADIVKYTFTGIVEITPTPKYKIYRALVQNGVGSQIFEADKDNVIYITDMERSATGVIHRKGKLILLNSFGKQVEIPFSFEYTR